MYNVYMCVCIYTYIHTPNLLILSVITRLLIIHIVLQWHQVVLCHLCACVGLHVCVRVCMYLPSEQKKKCVCTCVCVRVHVPRVRTKNGIFTTCSAPLPETRGGKQQNIHLHRQMITHTHTHTHKCIVCDVECTAATQQRTRKRLHTL